jgi:hypothetical protein
MITTAREWLAAFDALSDKERHEVVVELLRRSALEGGLSDEAFSLAYQEACQTLDAEEELQNAQPKRTAG